MKETSSNPRSRVFISYSHKDTDHLERLQIHLQPYVRQGTIDLWDDTKLEPGSNWREEIRQAITSAKIAVLLVSADFLASEFIARNELPPLLAAAKQDGAIILTVILSPCVFDDTELAQFQTVNDPSKPLSSMIGWKRDEVWVKVARRIKGILEEQQPHRLSTREPHADKHKHPVLRENFDHLIATHTQLFAGREDIISRIHKYIGENLSGYIFIEGLSGYGKTSLLAKIVQNHPEFAYHFISQTYRTYGSDFNPTELEWLMQNLCEQLEQESDQDFNNLRLRARFHHLLRTPSLNKAKVIIIDGVDEIDRHPNYLFGLLPTQLPSGIFIIFSARKLGGKNYLAELGLTSRNIHLHLDLPGLDASAIQQLLNQADGDAAQYSNNEPFIDGLHSISEGDPFYLRFLIEDVAEGIVRPDNLASVPSGLEEYLDKQFSILARSAYLPQHRILLGLVIKALGPLSKDELITMVPGLDEINFDNVIRDIHRFLLEYNNMFTLCHRRFKEYFYKKINGRERPDESTS